MKTLLALLLLSTYDATYTAKLTDLPANGRELEVWIPLPVTRGAQRIEAVRIDSPYAWTYHTDANGNRYAYAKIASPSSGELAVKVHFTATREEVHQAAEKKASKRELQRALKADRLVTLSPRIKKLANEITRGKKTKLDQARAIYDHLLATMQYDKTTPGWGMGDTERACDIRKGNCTDFHSLFMSLARAKGIPARFVIGFPLTAADGKVSGYHCWAEFYIDGIGWIPVDASDASKSKDPKVREFLFGNLDDARVQFTVGRDLELEPETAEPLNYFIHPYGEMEGRRTGVPSIGLEFTKR